MFDKLPEHEDGVSHKNCYWKWKKLQHTITTATGIDRQLQNQIQPEMYKNRALVERILDVTLYLASRNLPFWGKSLSLDDVHNGHYLGLLELLSNYDPLLREHLQKVRGNKKRARLTHYLSPESQNEFIGICGHMGFENNNL